MAEKTENKAPGKVFRASEEAKGKATRNRVIAGLLWLLAIVAQVWAITLLPKDPLPMTMIIILIGVDLALVIVGSILWKKSNKLHPPSEKNKFLFFMQSQLGMVTAIVAFLPLIIFILTNKNIDKKNKAILGGIAGAALLIAGITGIDFNPASVEKYTEEINAQTETVTDLTGGVDQVFWAPTGKKIHVYEDCQHLSNSDVSTGTVKEVWEARGIPDNEICKTCENRAMKAKTQIEAESLMDEEVEELMDSE